MLGRGNAKAKAELGVIRGGVHMTMELTSPVQDSLAGFCAENRQTDPLFVAQPGIYKGMTLALCGAGPSLIDADLRADHIFACNSALPYLVERGVNVSAGVGIDQTPGLAAEWADPPDVPYFLASTVDPELVGHLKSHGRVPTFFHSLVGFPDELDAYRKWPSTFMSFRGQNVVGRFLPLALWMGFERVDVYGADCAFGPDDVTHANGTSAEEAYGPVAAFQGVIDDKLWRTRADMLMAAVDLARQARDSGGRIRLIGDTLPNAIMDKGDEFLDQVCRTLAPDERAGQPPN